MKTLKILLALTIAAQLAFQQILLALIVAALLFQQLPLRSAFVFNTQPFACDSSVLPKTLSWVSPGLTVLRRARLWLGMDAGSVADFGYSVIRRRGGAVIFNGNWDHYADPRGLNDQIEIADFSHDFILLLPGDVVDLTYYCVSYSDLGPIHGHAVVLFWFPGL